jgi:hypothetical protein
MTRLAVFVAMLTVGLVLTGDALACSCAPVDPRAALERADGAFVGTLVDRVVDGEEAIHTFQVEEAVKGDIGQTIEVRSHWNGASCGLEIPEGVRVGLFVDRDGAVWRSILCQQIDPDELLAAAQPLPEPTGSGPVALLVGGSFGDVRTIALDEQGRVLSYGLGDGETQDLSVCPGGDHAVELVGIPGDFTWEYRLEVRDLATMAVAGTLAPVDWGSSYPTALRCLAADGSRAAVFARTDPGTDRLLVVEADGTRVIWRGEAKEGTFGPGQAYLCRGAKGRTVVAVSLTTGAQKVLATVPTFTGPLTPSPSGRYLAGVATDWSDFTDPAPAQAVVVDTKTGKTRTTDLASPYVTGKMLWLSRSRVVLVPAGGDADRVRVFDTALHQRGEGEQFYAYDAALYEGRLIGLVAPFLVQAGSPTGTFAELARLPSSVVWTLDAVTAGPEPSGRAAVWPR